ncbi:MAG: bifunctional hydroxymethylpyrimidine kinase/phosphomethylpyrimidine kinase [Planctomycetota bacterium]|jgi:hydroxymethylpyrimidine/phosphomethylpyrimidine kinase
MAPRVLSFGGLDPTAGAGILADVRVIADCGADPLAIASCLTVQNRMGLSQAEPSSPELIRGSLEAVFAEGVVDAIKTGLVLDSPSLEVFLQGLDEAGYAGPMVVDPVLSVSAGGWEAGQELLLAIAEQLLPRATVVTPNLPELAAMQPGGDAAALLGLGAKAVLLKDGHGTGPETVDRLITQDALQEFPRPRLNSGSVHGTGCALASALATFLARSRDLCSAAEAAVDKIQSYLARTPLSPDGRAVNLHIPAAS